MTNSKSSDRLLKIFSIAVVLVPVPILFGLNNKFSVPFFSLWSAMQFNTALGLFILGLGLFFLPSGKKTIVTGTAIFVFLLGALTYIEHISGLNFGIDELFRVARNSVYANHPGRMAVNSAFAFTLLGLTLLLVNIFSKSKLSTSFAALTAAGAASLSIATLVGAATKLDPGLGISSFVFMSIPTAIGLFLSAILLFVYSMRRLKKFCFNNYLQVPILLSSFLLLLTIIVWQFFLASETRRIRSEVGAVVDKAATSTKEHLRQTGLAITRYASRVEIVGLKNNFYLETDSKNYIQQLNIVKRIGITNADLKVIWSFPKELQQQINGYDQSKDPTRREAFLRAKDTRQAVLSKTLQLKSGGSGNIMATAMFRKDKYIGSIYGTIPTELLFKNLLNKSDLHYTIKEANKLLYEVSGADATNENFRIKYTLELGFEKWDISVVPTVTYIDSISSPMSTAALLVGIFLTLIIGIASSTVFQNFAEKNRLAAERDRLAAILESSPDFIGTADMAGNLTYHNKAAKKLVGDPETANWSNRKIKDMHPKWAGDLVLNEGIPAVLKKGSWTRETALLHRNGHEIPVSQVLMVHRNSEGEPEFLSTIVRDITGLMNTQKRLKEAEATALNVLNAKSQFLANMSHEIRTPLNAILGMTDLILETNLDSEQKKLAKTVATSGNHLLGVINDVLDYSKIEAGKVELEIIPFEITQFLESHADLLDVRARERNISLMTFIDPALPTKIQGDPSRLGQILLNFTSNAIKFSENSAVVLRADLAAPLMEQAKNVVVRISVQDSGMGIPESVRKKLFQAFVQADSSTSRKYGGTGLGLSISKNLATLMGGTVGVSSEVGKGSVFWFECSFPLSVADLTKVSAVGAGTKSGARILVVDDDPPAGEFVGAYIRNWGMEATRVDNGESALQLLNSAMALGRPFELAIIDSKVPKINGVSIGMKIRQSVAGAKMPMILVSPLDRRSPSQEVIEIGFHSCLQKPLKQSELYDSISNALSFAPLAGKQIKSGTKEALSAVRATKKEFRILVAEDNQVNQMLVAKYLEALGYPYQVVADGQAILDALAINMFDLILMDCQMPVMDGYEATQRIRKREAATGGHITIIALTANAMKEDEKLCLESGMDAVLTKPLKREKLDEYLTRWLSKSKSGSAA